MHRRAGFVLCSLLSVALAIAATGCDGDDGPPRRSPSPGGTPAATASGDLDLLLTRLESTHPEPFHGISREDFVAALDDLRHRLPDLTANQAVVEVSRVVAMLSAEGRDGHQFAVVADGHEAPMLPLRVYEFADGVYVTAATEPYADLVGTRITAIADHPITDVLAAIEPLVPRDGPATVADFRPSFLLRTDILDGLGIADPASVDVTVDGPDGERTVAVTPVDFPDYTGWAGAYGAIRLPERADTTYLADESTIFTSQRMASAGTLYVRYAEVRQPEPAALAAAREDASDPAMRRLVLDLRQNPGGDNHNNAALLGLLTTFRSAHPTAPIVVITDRVTFSAAANLATDAERQFAPVFVGEPMGGGLNFWNDVTWVELVNLPVPMRVGVSTRYWERSTPDDPRLTIDPDVAIPVSAADYFAGRDPALEAALAVAPGTAHVGAPAQPLPGGKEDLDLSAGTYLSPDGFEPALSFVVGSGWRSVHRYADGFDLARPGADGPAAIVAVVRSPRDSAEAALDALRDQATGTVSDTVINLANGQVIPALSVAGGTGPLVESADHGIAIDALDGGHAVVGAWDRPEGTVLVVVLYPDQAYGATESGAVTALLASISAAG
jgi:hypothetical protein